MNKLLHGLDRAYRVLLLAHPRAFRAEYAPLMAQAFRDQCCAAQRQHGALGVLRLLPATLFDLLRTSIHEHLLNYSPMNLFQHPHKLSNLLLWSGLGVGFLSGAFFKLPFFVVGGCYLCSTIFVARTFAEWKRPHADWWKGILTGLLVAVAFGLFAPAWAKILAMHNLDRLLAPLVVFAPVLLSLLVPLAKAAVHFLRLRRLS